MTEFQNDDNMKREQLKYHKKRVLASKAFTFDATHHLYSAKGKSKKLLSHKYRVIFGISGYVDDFGIVIDFFHIQKIWEAEIEMYFKDQYLNESLPPMNTTAENMVVWIYEKMDGTLQREEWQNQHNGMRLEFVRLYETPSGYAEAKREWMEME